MFIYVKKNHWFYIIEVLPLELIEFGVFLYYQFMLRLKLDRVDNIIDTTFGVLLYLTNPYTRNLMILS